MPTQIDYEAETQNRHKLIAPKGRDDQFVSAKFSDSCQNCKHTRAEHLNKEAPLSMYAVTDCNKDDCKCERWS